jgi:hypothetical protein
MALKKQLNTIYVNLCFTFFARKLRPKLIHKIDPRAVFAFVDRLA